MKQNSKSKKPKKLTERQCVRLYIKQFCKGAYVFVDTDSPFRVHKSGWDFVKTALGTTAYYEAKKINITKGKFEPIEYNYMKLLTSTQKVALRKVTKNNGIYVVLLFTDYGKYGVGCGLYVHDNSGWAGYEYQGTLYH